MTIQETLWTGVLHGGGLNKRTMCLFSPLLPMVTMQDGTGTHEKLK